MYRTSLAALALLLLAAPAFAQQPPPTPGLDDDPYRALNGGPYWGYWRHISPAADVIEAQGQFLIDMQRVNLLIQQVQREKLVTRRKQLEHWAWEREFIPQKLEEQRQMSHEMEVRRIVNDPPPVEIYSAAVLNTLLKELLQHTDQLTPDGSVPVEQQWLAHVHVASEAFVGNAGLLKRDKLPWPLLVLGRPDLSDERTAIEEELARSKAAVLRHETPAKEIIDMRKRIDKLQAKLRSEVHSGSRDDDWNPNQFIAAQRSLKEIKDALVLLEQPDAAEYLNPLKGKNVAELVYHMKSQGLRFAPATWGDERYYTALYYALRDELKRIGGVPAMPGKS